MRNSEFISAITMVIMVLAGSSAQSSEPSVSTPGAGAEERDTLSGALEMFCKHGNDERMLIMVPKGSGCELHYHKFGKNLIAASSAFGQRHCEEVRHQMRENLETASFVCGGIQSE